MRWITLNNLGVCVFLIVVLQLNGSHAQTRRGYPTPPPPAVPEDGPAPPKPNLPIRLDSMAIEREAKEMAALASSISGDFESIKKGLLPRDTLNNLKKIEKLARQLRGQLRP